MIEGLLFRYSRLPACHDVFYYKEEGNKAYKRKVNWKKDVHLFVKQVSHLYLGIWTKLVSMTSNLFPHSQHSTFLILSHEMNRYFINLLVIRW